MQEHDSTPKDSFVLSGKRSGSNEREEAFEYSPAKEDGVKKSSKPIVLAGAGLILAVVVLLMFLSGSPKSVDKEQLKTIEGRLKLIEEKLAKLEWIDTGLARLDRKEKEIASISDRMAQTEAALNKKADLIARETAKLVSRPAEVPPPKAETPSAKPAAPASKVDKDIKTKVYVVQKGDTIFGISRKYGIPADQLIKLNKLDLKDPIKPGQQLALPPPKSG
jgi:LysM repeat protein